MTTVIRRPSIHHSWTFTVDNSNRESPPVVERGRVLLVTMEVIGASKGGGIATAYTALAEALAAAGHQVTVLFTERNYLGVWQFWVDQYKNEKGVELVRLWDSEREGAAEWPEIDVGKEGCATRACARSYRAYLWLRKRVHSFDIVHFHDNGGIGHFSQLAKHHGEEGFSNLVFFHGAHGPHFWERLANEFILGDYRHLEVDHMERKMAQLSDMVVSPSAYMVQWMQNMKWILPRHTYVHQNILPKPLFQPNLTDQSSPIDEVVFFGRLEKRKGLFTFLNALALLVSNYTSPVPILQANSTDALNSTWLNLSHTSNNYLLGGARVTFLGRTTLVDAGTMAHQFIERWCNQLMIVCEIKSDMSQPEALAYLADSSKFAIIASPVDNSPNTVLECLSYGIKFLASDTGGIPELVHSKDRDRVLFKPYPNDLAKLLESILIRHQPLKQVAPAVPNQLRTSLWVDVHSSLIPSLFEPQVSQPKIDSSRETVTLVVQLWCTSNITRMLQSVSEQDYSLDRIILGVPQRCFDSLARSINSFMNLRIHVIKVVDEAEEDMLLQSWNQLSHTTNTPSYLLLMDPSSWLSYRYSLNRLVGIAVKTNATVVTSAYVDTKNNNTVVAYTGCSNGNAITFNCFDMLVNATLFNEIAPEFPRGVNVWEFYAHLHAIGHIIEPAIDTHFSLYKLEPPIPRSTSLATMSAPSASVGKQQIVRYYADTLPPGLESFVTVASHCLMSHSNNPPSPEALTQHIDLLFVRGFQNSGVRVVENLVRTTLGIHVLPGAANFHIITNALRSFIASPPVASQEIYALHTKKWYLSFVRSFLLAELPLDMASSYSWAAEVALTSINPLIPGASYLHIRRDGRDVMVAYYHQYLWCYDRMHVPALCQQHINETLIHSDDLQAYNSDKEYFQKRPKQLFRLEEPFRQLASAWADRILEDKQAEERIMQREIDTRLLLLEYNQVVAFSQAWKAEIAKFLSLEVDGVDLSSSTVLAWEGDWELDLQRQSDTAGQPVWQIYFNQDAADWFTQEAGEVLQSYERKS